MSVGVTEGAGVAVCAAVGGLVLAEAANSPFQMDSRAANSTGTPEVAVNVQMSSADKYD